MNYVRYVEKTKESKGEIKQIDKVGLMPRHFEAYTSIYVVLLVTKVLPIAM